MILAVLCGGKLADKLRCKFFLILMPNILLKITFLSDTFSQMSDSNGQLVAPKFEDFMRQCFVLTAAVGEEPSFYYRPAMAQEIFPNVIFIIGFAPKRIHN